MNNNHKIPKYKKGDVVYYPTLLGGVRKGVIKKVIQQHEGDAISYEVTPVNKYYFDTIILNEYIYTNRSSAYRGYKRWKNMANIG